MIVLAIFDIICFLIRIIRVRESGLYKVWIDLILKLVGNTRFLEENDEHIVIKYEKISFEYVLDVYYLLLIGILASILGLILEFTYKYIA